MDKLQKMHFDQVVEYTISISTPTGKKLDREDIEAEGWKCIDIENFDGSSRFTMMGKDQRNPPLSEYTLIFTRSGWVLISQNEVPRFSGNIRNRSELHFILKALTII